MPTGFTPIQAVGAFFGFPVLWSDHAAPLSERLKRLQEFGVTAIHADRRRARLIASAPARGEIVLRHYQVAAPTLVALSHIDFRPTPRLYLTPGALHFHPDTIEAALVTVLERFLNVLGQPQPQMNALLFSGSALPLQRYPVNSEHPNRAWLPASAT